MKLSHSSAVAFALAWAALPVPSTAHAETFSYHDSGLVMSGGCSSYDEATGTYTSVMVTAGVRRDHFPGDGPREYSFGYIIYSTYNIFTGEDCSGYGYLTELSINPGLASGTASATVTLNCRTINPDTGAYEDSTADVLVTARLEGYGDAVGGVYSYRFNDPSHYNSVSVTSGSSRNATPTFTVDGDELSFAGANSESIGYLNDGWLVTKATYVP